MCCTFSAHDYNPKYHKVFNIHVHMRITPCRTQGTQRYAFDEDGSGIIRSRTRHGLSSQAFLI